MGTPLLFARVGDVASVGDVDELLCITIIGIPLGLGNSELIPLALTPFGKDIVRNGSAHGDVMVSF